MMKNANQIITVDTAKKFLNGYYKAICYIKWPFVTLCAILSVFGYYDLFQMPEIRSIGITKVISSLIPIYILFFAVVLGFALIFNFRFGKRGRGISLFMTSLIGSIVAVGMLIIEFDNYNVSIAIGIVFLILIMIMLVAKCYCSIMVEKYNKAQQHGEQN